MKSFKEKFSKGFKKCVRKSVKQSSGQKTAVIGIMGLGRGVGTTHLSIMLGNYLANGLGKTVALLELNKNNAHMQIRQLKHIKCIEHAKSGTKSCFRLNRMDFYENISSEDIPQIMAANYNYVILDVSANYLLGKNEFLRSHKKIVVGSLSKWKAHEYLNYFEKIQLEKETAACQYLALTKDVEIFKIIKKKYNTEIEKIPFEENPFYLEGSHMEWIEKFLK